MRCLSQLCPLFLCQNLNKLETVYCCQQFILGHVSMRIFTANIATRCHSKNLGFYFCPLIRSLCLSAAVVNGEAIVIIKAWWHCLAGTATDGLLPGSHNACRSFHSGLFLERWKHEREIGWQAFDYMNVTQILFLMHEMTEWRMNNSPR